MDMGLSCRKKVFFPGVHTIGAPISGPRNADKNFTDTRIFSEKCASSPAARGRLAAECHLQGFTTPWPGGLVNLSSLVLVSSKDKARDESS